MHVLKENGQLWGWGNNQHGAVGNGNFINVGSPVQVLGNHSFIKVSGGWSSVLALKQDNSLWTWGRTYFDQSNASPVQIFSSFTFIDITAHNTHYPTWFGLDSNGQAWGWGNNFTGQLGDGTRTDTTSPVQVIGNHSFQKLYQGEYNTYALKSDGSLWSWGSGDTGSLGDGTNTDKSSPVQVVGNHSFTSFTAGQYTAYGLKSNGEVWSWGINDSGQLGTNNITSYSSPVQVVGNHSFQQICAVFDIFQGLKEDGSLWGMGNNRDGFVGVGEVNNSYSSPVQVIGNQSFTHISSVNYDYFALKNNGEIWSWGFDARYDTASGSTRSPRVIVGDHSFIALTSGFNSNVNVSNTWRNFNYGYICIEEEWNRILEIYILNDGEWKKTIDRN
jgi:alpha-tubulin suppressor-like RCC1 family protein